MSTDLHYMLALIEQSRLSAGNSKGILYLHRRSAAHWCLQKADIILIRLVQAADKLLQPWNDLNLQILQAGCL